MCDGWVTGGVRGCQVGDRGCQVGDRVIGG